MTTGNGPPFYGAFAISGMKGASGTLPSTRSGLSPSVAVKKGDR